MSAVLLLRGPNTAAARRAVIDARDRWLRETPAPAAPVTPAPPASDALPESGWWEFDGLDIVPAASMLADWGVPPAPDGHLPPVIVMQDAHAWDDDRTALIERVEAAATPCAVIALAWPTRYTNPAFDAWLEGARARGSVDIVDLPALDSPDAAALARRLLPGGTAAERADVATALTEVAARHVLTPWAATYSEQRERVLDTIEALLADATPGPDAVAATVRDAAGAWLDAHRDGLGLLGDPWTVAVAHWFVGLDAPAGPTRAAAHWVIAWSNADDDTEDALAHGRQALADLPDAAAHDRLVVRAAMAGWLADLGRSADALAELTATLDAAREQQGPDGEDVLTLRDRRAVLLSDLGRHDEAVAELRALVDDLGARQGADDPDTLVSRANLVHALAAADRLDEAVAQADGLVAGLTRSLGAQHPDTLSAQALTASLVGGAGDPAAAAERYAALVDARAAVSGPRSAETLLARAQYAYWLGMAGWPADAVDELRWLIGHTEEHRGETHPHALAMRINLAFFLGAAGWPDEAAAEYEAVLPLLDATLGPDHPTTLTAREGYTDLRAGRDPAP